MKRSSSGSLTLNKAVTDFLNFKTATEMPTVKAITSSYYTSSHYRVR